MIETTLNTDLKNAMVKRDQDLLEAIRTIKTVIQVEKAKEGTDLNDEQIIKIIQKLVSQRTESASQYTSGGRSDLADHEMYLVSVFKTYLPEQMTEAEITAKIKDFIAQTGATSVKDMGKVMAIVNKDFVGKADMKMVGGIVKTLLTQ